MNNLNFRGSLDKYMIDFSMKNYNIWLMASSYSNVEKVALEYIKCLSVSEKTKEVLHKSMRINKI